MEKKEFDRIDEGILKLLRQNEELPTWFIAMKLGVKRETLSYRLFRLVSQGLVERRVYGTRRTTWALKEVSK